MTAGVDEMKKAMRAQMRRSLAVITSANALSAGRTIGIALTEDPRWSSWSAIALYSSLPGEVDLSGVATAAWSAGKRVALPCTLADGTMEFREYRQADVLVSGRFGVLEPPREAQVLSVRALSCVLVPGLAFDTSGGRLGRGAGYYDRALAETSVHAALRAPSSELKRDRPLRIGVGFALQVVDRVPMSSLDIRMDACMTEVGWLDLDQSADRSD